MRLNSIRVAGGEYLIVHGSGGTAHLAAEEVEAGRPAFDEEDFESARRRGFTDDGPILREARWSPKALCGNEWGCMSPTDETAAFFWWTADEVVAPECKKCLRTLDKLFPAPDVKPAVHILADLAAEQVVEHGSTEIHRVPADQVEALRKFAKHALRAKGFSARTYLRGDIVIVWSDAAHDAIPVEVQRARDREVADAMTARYEGVERPPRATPWRLYWTTWDV